MNKVRIDQGRILDSGYRYMISLMLTGGMVLSVIYLNNMIGFIFMMFLGSLMILLWTSFYVVEIDITNRTYGERRSILGRSFGERQLYQGIESIVLEEVNFDDGVQGAIVEFDAYVKFTNGEKIFLVSDEDENELRKRLKPVLKKLKTEIKF